MYSYKIKALLSDCDGCLTDGMLHYMSNGGAI